MNIRYIGPDPSRDLAMPGGVITCPRREWIDLEAEAAASQIGGHHLPIVVNGLLDHPDWEIEGAPKAPRKPRGNQRSTTTEPKEAST